MFSCGLAHAQQADDPIGKRDRGIKLYEQGKDGEAVKVLQALVKRYKTEARAWHYLGLALSRKGKTKEARKAHEQSTQSAVEFTQESPATAREMTTRGIEMYKRGDVKGAIKTLRAAVNLNKDDPESWYYLGSPLAADNEFKDARKAFENSVRLRPDFTDARAALAYMLLLEQKGIEAEREAQIVLNTDERNAEAHYVLGDLRLIANSARTSLVEAEKALAVSPDLLLQ